MSNPAASDDAGPVPLSCSATTAHGEIRMVIADAPSAAPVKQLRTMKGDPDALYDVPVLDRDEEYRSADILENVVQGLINAFPDRFGTLQPLNIRVMWKRSGRTSRGREILGQALRPGGIAKHLLEDVDYLLLVAADHCRTQGMTQYTMEALLFRLLCSCFVDAEGKCTILGPDFDGFVAELNAYGAWTTDLQIGARAFRTTPVQLSMDDVPSGVTDVDDDDEL